MSKSLELFIAGHFCLTVSFLNNTINSNTQSLLSLSLSPTDWTERRQGRQSLTELNFYTFKLDSTYICITSCRHIKLKVKNLMASCVRTFLHMMCASWNAGMQQQVSPARTDPIAKLHAELSHHTSESVHVGVEFFSWSWFTTLTHKKRSITHNCGINKPIIHSS